MQQHDAAMKDSERISVIATLVSGQ